MAILDNMNHKYNDGHPPINFNLKGKKISKDL